MFAMVYLIHFNLPFKHAEHYIGFVENKGNLDARMNHHRTGSGSRLMHAVSKAGIGWEIARLWEDGDRNFERKLKNWKKNKRLCPICKAKKKVT